MKILIIGSSGFLGSHLARQLGVEVEVVPFDITLGNDMRNHDEVSEAATAADCIFFFGAAAVGRRSIDVSPNIGDIEYDGICVVAKVAAALGKPLYYASSIRAYGTSQEMVAGEKHMPHPTSAYGKVKLRCEQALVDTMQQTGTPYYIFRICAVYGKDMPEDFIIASFLRDILAGKALHLLSTGTQQRNFMYIDDVCEVFIRFLKAERAESGIYNIAHYETVKVLDLAALCGTVVGKDVHIYPASNISAEPDEIIATEKITKAIGQYPCRSLSEGLAALYDAPITP